MALIGNYSLLNKSPGLNIGGTTGNDRANFNKVSDNHNRFVGNYNNTSATPVGYQMKGYVQPLKAGGGRGIAASSGTGVLALAGGRNMEANGSSTGISSAVGAAIASMVASGSAVGAGTISMSGLASMVASGSATGVGSLILSAIASMVANSEAIGTGSAEMTAIGHMEASGGGATPLSPEGLAVSLLDEQDVETGYSVREALRIILAAMGGKVSGAGTSTITFRNVTDDKDRIIATVDNDGNRTSVTLDVT